MQIPCFLSFVYAFTLLVASVVAKSVSYIPGLVIKFLLALPLDLVLSIPNGHLFPFLSLYAVAESYDHSFFRFFVISTFPYLFGPCTYII